MTDMCSGESKLERVCPHIHLARPSIAGLCLECIHWGQQLPMVSTVNAQFTKQSITFTLLLKVYTSYQFTYEVHFWFAITLPHLSFVYIAIIIYVVCVVEVVICVIVIVRVVKIVISVVVIISIIKISIIKISIIKVLLLIIILYKIIIIIGVIVEIIISHLFFI